MENQNYVGCKVYHESGEFVGRVVSVTRHWRGGVAGVTTDFYAPGIYPPVKFVAFWNRTRQRFESRMFRGTFSLVSESV